VPRPDERPASRTDESGPATKRPVDPKELPYFLTPTEAADLLRTTRSAIYARFERNRLPGAIRDGRRLLIVRDELLQSLSETRAPSPGGLRR
jgi:excisionase family DNA binding protein